MDEPPQSGEETQTESAPDPGRSIPRDVLELDHVYEALGHPRRRYILYTLQADTEWTLDELAAKIASYEEDVSPRDVDDKRRDRIYLSLYHTHVPKLVDLAVVSFDEDSETIVAATHAEQVLRALEGMGESLDSTQERHARTEIDDRDE